MQLSHIAGVDEAGRGPLVGPVVAAAVILPADFPTQNLNDSKKLSAKKRDYLYDMIVDRALSFGIASASAQEIDQINILQASLLAMYRAIQQLKIKPHQIWIDGNQIPRQLDQDLNYKPLIKKTIVNGDALEPCISAASILAKVTRDRYMEELALAYPDYGFEKHKGYPTASHLGALNQLAKKGLMPEYRKSFKPVKEIEKELEYV
ncbi:MAG: ribonuclease HII [Gammaproteobacteria bacterium]